MIQCFEISQEQHGIIRTWLVVFYGERERNYQYYRKMLHLKTEEIILKDLSTEHCSAQVGNSRPVKFFKERKFAVTSVPCFEKID